MVQVFGIAAVLAVVAMVFAGAAALTYTAICIIAGYGLGSIVTIGIMYGRFEEQQQKEEQRREREHRRMLELLAAGAAFRPEMKVVDQVKRLAR